MIGQLTSGMLYICILPVHFTWKLVQTTINNYSIAHINTKSSESFGCRRAIAKSRYHISPLGYKQPDRFNMGEEVRTNPDPFALFLQPSVIGLKLIWYLLRWG